MGVMARKMQVVAKDPTIYCGFCYCIVIEEHT